MPSNNTSFARPPPKVQTMRLSVQVLPPALSQAYAGITVNNNASIDKFALPVKADDTFEAVWEKIEEHYRRIYPHKAQSFRIKKLQDGFDADLGLSFTVREIFDDPGQERLVKVHLVDATREMSIMPGSDLRPNVIRKRRIDDPESTSGKRRRIAVGRIDEEDDAEEAEETTEVRASVERPSNHEIPPLYERNDEDISEASLNHSRPRRRQHQKPGIMTAKVDRTLDSYEASNDMNDFVSPAGSAFVPVETTEIGGAGEDSEAQEDTFGMFARRRSTKLNLPQATSGDPFDVPEAQPRSPVAEYPNPSSSGRLPKKGLRVANMGRSGAAQSQRPATAVKTNGQPDSVDQTRITSSIRKGGINGKQTPHSSRSKMTGLKLEIFQSEAELRSMGIQPPTPPDLSNDEESDARLRKKIQTKNSARRRNYLTTLQNVIEDARERSEARKKSPQVVIKKRKAGSADKTRSSQKGKAPDKSGGPAARSDSRSESAQASHDIINEAVFETGPRTFKYHERSKRAEPQETGDGDEGLEPLPADTTHQSNKRTPSQPDSIDVLHELSSQIAQRKALNLLSPQSPVDGHTSMLEAEASHSSDAETAESPTFEKALRQAKAENADEDEDTRDSSPENDSTSRLGEAASQQLLSEERASLTKQDNMTDSQLPLPEIIADAADVPETLDSESVKDDSEFDDLITAESEPAGLILHGRDPSPGSDNNDSDHVGEEEQQEGEEEEEEQEELDIVPIKPARSSHEEHDLEAARSPSPELGDPISMRRYSYNGPDTDPIEAPEEADSTMQDAGAPLKPEIEGKDEDEDEDSDPEPDITMAQSPAQHIDNVTAHPDKHDTNTELNGSDVDMAGAEDAVSQERTPLVLAKGQQSEDDAASSSDRHSVNGHNDTEDLEVAPDESANPGNNSVVIPESPMKERTSAALMKQDASAPASSHPVVQDSQPIQAKSPRKASPKPMNGYKSSSEDDSSSDSDSDSGPDEIPGKPIVKSNANRFLSASQPMSLQTTRKPISRLTSGFSPRASSQPFLSGGALSRPDGPRTLSELAQGQRTPTPPPQPAPLTKNMYEESTADESSEDESDASSSSGDSGNDSDTPAKPVSPKQNTIKSPVKTFDTTKNDSSSDDSSDSDDEGDAENTPASQPPQKCIPATHASPPVQKPDDVALHTGNDKDSSTSVSSSSSDTSSDDSENPDDKAPPKIEPKYVTAITPPGRKPLAALKPGKPKLSRKTPSKDVNARSNIKASQGKATDAQGEKAASEISSDSESDSDNDSSGFESAPPVVAPKSQPTFRTPILPSPSPSKPTKSVPPPKSIPPASQPASKSRTTSAPILPSPSPKKQPASQPSPKKNGTSKVQTPRPKPAVQNSKARKAPFKTPATQTAPPRISMTPISPPGSRKP